MAGLGILATWAADGCFSLGNMLDALAVRLLDRTVGESS